MRRLLTGPGLALLVVAGGCAAPEPRVQAAPAREVVPASREQVRLTFAPVVREVAPAVVNVFTRKRRARSPLFDDPFFRRFFGAPGPRVETSLGSGVIVRSDGLIVTNAHVIEEAEEVMVVLADRREFEAEIVSADENVDLALLKVDPGGEPLPVLALGNSDDLEVGDLVLAIGDPFGIGQTVTSGIVSALARTTLSHGGGPPLIQTDASINPGNSGGALVTIDGTLVGINTAILSQGGGSIGIGFAIPANLVQALIRSFESGGQGLARPWLGASVQPVDADLASALELARPQGLVIREVYPGGPAARAGLQPGDVVLAIGGIEILDEGGLDFRLAVGGLGQSAPLEVQRRGRTFEVDLPLEAPPYQPPPDITKLSGRQPLAGAVVGNLSPGLNRELGLSPTERGVQVLQVQPGTPAARLGLRPGDRVLTVGDQPVDDVDQLESRLDRSYRQLRIEIERDGRRLAVVLG